MRVLVTGAGGFLGRAVVPRLLEDRHELILVGRSEPSEELPQGVQYQRVDLERPEQLARAVAKPSAIDAIVHLAGEAPKGDMGWNAEATPLVQSHVRLALTLREVFEGFGGRVVHASGMPVYGVPERLPISESAARKPIHMYGLAKLLSEEVMLAWPGVERWVLRLPGLFSESRRSGGLFHFMRAAAAGEPIRVTASRPTPWDVLHVQDAALAIALALGSSAPAPGALNISYGEPVDLLSMAERVRDLAGSSAPVVNTQQVEHPSFQMDIAAAQRLLDWPPVSLGQRLEQLYQDFGFSRQ